MKTKNIIKFMDDINTVINFIEGAIRMDEIVNFRLEDKGEIIRFSIQRGHHDILCAEITKMDEDSLQVIYAAIAAKYQKNMEIGATSEFHGKEVTWNLAPVINDNTLIEFVSSHKKDQKWFYEELERSTKEKGPRK